MSGIVRVVFVVVVVVVVVMLVVMVMLVVIVAAIMAVVVITVVVMVLVVEVLVMASLSMIFDVPVMVPVFEVWLPFPALELASAAPVQFATLDGVEALEEALESSAVVMWLAVLAASCTAVVADEEAVETSSVVLLPVAWADVSPAVDGKETFEASPPSKGSSSAFSLDRYSRCLPRHMPSQQLRAKRIPARVTLGFIIEVSVISNG
mmetsp:Transcript_67562/g.147172  ORF Transcript_67562/g.147172 Transcript_67562/m.147172 type:complete len:207 (+) Transcript_67562:293-913(+)